MDVSHVSYGKEGHAEASAMNRLGRLFREFARLEHEVLIWTPTDGRLVKTSTEAELDAPPASVS